MADTTKTLKDAAYVLIGLGVIATQKVQVRRRELQKQLEAQLKHLEAQRKQLETQAATATAQFTKLAEGFVQQARLTATEAQDQVKTRLSRAA
jgi:uncharacterized membrane-anchored protein YhcB (DUF1043 family)